MKKATVQIFKIAVAVVFPIAVGLFAMMALWAAYDYHRHGMLLWDAKHYVGVGSLTIGLLAGWITSPYGPLNIYERLPWESSGAGGSVRRK